MLGGELLVSLALGERLGRLNEAAAAVGIFFKVHVTPSAYPGALQVTEGTAGTSSLG